MNADNMMTLDGVWSTAGQGRPLGWVGRVQWQLTDEQVAAITAGRVMKAHDGDCLRAALHRGRVTEIELYAVSMRTDAGPRATWYTVDTNDEIGRDTIADSTLAQDDVVDSLTDVWPVSMRMDDMQRRAGVAALTEAVDTLGRAVLAEGLLDGRDEA